MTEPTSESTEKHDSSPPESPQLPGLSLELFKASVEALSQLADEGVYLIFVSPPYRVRLVGDRKLFQSAFSQRARLPQKDAQRKVKSAISEMEKFIRLCLAIPNNNNRLKHLENKVFKEAFEQSGVDQAALRQHLEGKIRCIEEQDYFQRLCRRRDRLATLLGPFIQDLDYELITERRDRVQESVIRQPFLRIRIRYGLTNHQDVLLRMFNESPWEREPSHLFATEIMEFECDEDEIDLLILRLAEAKELLLRAIESRSEPSGEHSS